MLSRLKTGSWSINDVYGRINFDCWSYEACGSGNYGLYVWGHNPHGEHGYNRTGGDSHVPIQVGAVDCWNSHPDDMAGCYWLVSTKTDGTAWAWGLNNHGQLGSGSYTPRSSPQQIPGCWRHIGAGFYHTVGIKCDGTLWTWGYNGHGELGRGVAGGSCPTPIQVGTATDWCAGHAGHYQSYAIKCNGNLFSWGYNPHGDLALGDTIPRCSPVQIPGTWTCAKGYRPGLGRKSDGCHYTWGHNPHGQLGNGNTSNYCSPILLPGSWCHISNPPSKHHNVAGVKNDGTLWVWGHANHGELGVCCTVSTVSTPCNGVPGNTWCNVGVGYNRVYGIKTDGTLWGWGTNPHGNIDSTNLPRCSPQQIPGNYWKDVAGAHWYTTARTNGISQCQEGINFEDYPSVFYQSFCAF